jgi:hypothetical protein
MRIRRNFQFWKKPNICDADTKIMTTDTNLQLHGLSIYVGGREFPNASDYWDGNWLIVRASMEAKGARVDCAGPILRTTDFKRFRDELRIMAETLAGTATLSGLELELNVVFKMVSRGRMEVEVEITPDHLTQSHNFSMELDQSYLPPLITFCESILEKFPVMGAPEA